jgi:hypothetical protein
MKRFIITGFLSAIVMVIYFVFAINLGNMDKTQAEMKTMQANLGSTKSEISSLESLVASATVELSTTTNELSATKTNFSVANAELSATKTKLSTSKAENAKLRSGDKYNLRAPTYKEVIDFIAADQTNTKQFAPGVYNICYLGSEVINTAKEKGLRCAAASVVFRDGSYYPLVVFQTSDAGLVFISSIDDKVMKVTKGGHLWQDNNDSAKYDDTIVDILIYW